MRRSPTPGPRGLGNDNPSMCTISMHRPVLLTILQRSAPCLQGLLVDGGDHCVGHVTIDKTNSKHPMHDQFMRASKWHLLLTLKSSDTFQKPELNFSLIMLLCCTVSITHCKCLCCGGLSHEFMDGWMDGWGSHHQIRLCFICLCVYK